MSAKLFGDPTVSNQQHGAAVALQFQETTFDVLEIHGQPWLRGTQIGDALGYPHARQAIGKLFERNSDEFRDDMTCVVDLPTAGGVQPVRLFSLRGAHLLGMLANTKVAMAFRRWVLDVLDGIEVPEDVKPLSHTQRLAYLRERRSLLRELGAVPSAQQRGLAEELYAQFRVISRWLGITPQQLEALAPGLKQLAMGG